jgi:hypothetical protein
MQLKQGLEVVKKNISYILIPLVGIVIQVVFLSDTNVDNKNVITNNKVALRTPTNGAISGTIIETTVIDNEPYVEEPIPDVMDVPAEEPVGEPVIIESNIPIRETYVSDIFSCGIPTRLKLIAEGVVTDISYITVKDQTGYKTKYINFTMGHQRMTLNYDKTDSPVRNDIEIYNTDGRPGIIPGKLYYVYDWDGMRTVWSRVPKELDGGMLVNTK